MKKLFVILVFLLVALSLSACKNQGPVVNIINGDFELGTFSEWTQEGEAFQSSITNAVTFEGSRKYMQSNMYHVTTKEATTTGSITSNVFTLSGLGYITFLIGGNATTENTYVAIIDAETKEILETINNYSYNDEMFSDNYVRIVWDLNLYLERNIQVQVVDNDLELGYINVDDFTTFIESEDDLNNYREDSLLRLGVRTDNLLLSAEYYINLHKQIINPDYRYTYHVMGEIGWINDPNGFVYFENQYHLFYQHNPYSSLWGPMHWGHVTSDDLIKWEYQPIAVAPIVFDAGGGAAFSGSAIEVDNSLYLLYTENWPGYQYQVIAKSNDGITFEKLNDGLPVMDDSLLPWYTNPVDFRDPKIWEKDGVYYAVVGSRQINDFGQVLLFTSENLIDWTLVGPIIQGSQNTIYTLGYMFECPDLFELGEKDVLIMSPQQIPGHRNTHGTVYVVGDLNYQTGSLNNWILEDIKEIDYGFDFYAPQTMIDDQGRRIMIAWMQSWNRSPMTAGLGWAGAMTIPRELTLSDNGNLIQYPIKELETYRTNMEQYDENISGNVNTFIHGNILDLEITLETNNGKTGITLFANENGEGTKIYYEDGYVYLDRTESMGGRFPGEKNNITKAPVSINENGEIKLRILLDRHSVEVFINGGEQAITSTIYFIPENDNIFVFSDNLSRIYIQKWNLDTE